MSDIEVEWQLDALDLRPMERWLHAAGREQALLDTEAPVTGLSTVTSVARGAERLVDTYLDTEDWRMARSGHVLRVRHRAGRGDVTMKDDAPASSGLRRRLEVTERLPEGGVAALGSGGPVGWRVRALAGRRPLVHVLEVRTRRRPFDLYVADERVAEVALDETTIVVSGDHHPVRLQRVEIEAVPSWVGPLTPLVDTLQRECGLRPATLSKFEAGLLAAGVRIPGPPDLGPTVIGAEPSVGDLAFAVLRRQFGAVLANEPGSRLGQDPEALHDMRVATRRLRAALAQFADALPVRAHHVRSELGWLGGALGAVRDLDVQLERLDAWRSEVPEEDRAALDDLAAVLHRERDEARATLLADLDSPRYERLAAGFSTMLRQGPSRRSAAARAPAIVTVPDLVEARHRAALKAARRARRSGDADDFHTLRIRAKRLRYALEFVSELYPGQTARYVRAVVKLQDALGLMQDARVATTRLHELATATRSGLSPTTVFVMGGIAERYRHEAQTLARAVPQRMKRLRGKAWRRLMGLMEHRRLEHGSLSRWASSVTSAGPVGREGDGAPGGRRTPWVRDPVPPRPSAPGLEPIHPDDTERPRHPSNLPPATPRAGPASAAPASPLAPGAPLVHEEAVAGDDRAAVTEGGRPQAERPSTNGDGSGRDER